MTFVWIDLGFHPDRSAIPVDVLEQIIAAVLLTKVSQCINEFKANRLLFVSEGGMELKTKVVDVDSL